MKIIKKGCKNNSISKFCNTEKKISIMYNGINIIDQMSFINGLRVKLSMIIYIRD